MVFVNLFSFVIFLIASDKGNAYLYPLALFPFGFCFLGFFNLIYLYMLVSIVRCMMLIVHYILSWSGINMYHIVYQKIYCIV